MLGPTGPSRPDGGGVGELSQRPAMRLAVNPIQCEAHGLCAELLPERVSLDEWGYPILDGAPLTPELLDHARRAADACPTLALLLEREAR
jgi:ferredoxin